MNMRVLDLHSLGNVSTYYRKREFFGGGANLPGKAVETKAAIAPNVVPVSPYAGPAPEVSHSSNESIACTK